MTENIITDAFLADDDCAPMDEAEFNNLGSFEPLEGPEEDLVFTGWAVDEGQAKKGHQEVTVRLGFKVNEPGRNNPPGRPHSIFLRIPEKRARATNEKLEQQFNINKGDAKKIFLALLGGESADNPGDYPVENGQLMNPLAFFRTPDMEDLLKGRIMTVDVKAQDPTYVDKATNAVIKRKRVGADVFNFRPFSA